MRQLVGRTRLQMILIDVNLLVCAYRVEADRHVPAAEWLTAILSGPQEISLINDVLAGFLRIVTNPKIFVDPAPSQHALGFVEALIASPRARWTSTSQATWRTVRNLVDNDRGLRGHLIPDAVLASTAVAHGMRLATCDHGFARFPDLDWFDPLAD